MTLPETRQKLEAARREVIRLEKQVRAEKAAADESIRQRRIDRMNKMQSAFTRARNQSMMLRRMMTESTYKQIGDSVGISATAANHIISREFRSMCSDKEHELRFLFDIMDNNYAEDPFKRLRYETPVVLRPYR